MDINRAVTGHRIDKLGYGFTLNAWTPGQDVVLGPLISIDTETELIVDHTFPDLVLLQVTAGTRVDLVSYEHAAEYLRLLLRYNPQSIMVFVNAAYDLGVLCRDIDVPLYDLIDEGRIVDMMDRYKLWEISERGFVRKPASLAGMARNVLGLKVKKDDELRLMFTRGKDPSYDQLIYGADDVIITWLLAKKMPKMTTENDSQIMGSIVLDAISRHGMLVDREHFDKKLAEFQLKYEQDQEYLEMRGYNPLLGQPSTHVLRDGLNALGIHDMPAKATGPVLEYLLYKSLFYAHQELDEFRENVKRWIAEVDAEECGFLSVKDAAEHYAEVLQEGFKDVEKLKRDRLVLAREVVKKLDVPELVLRTGHEKIDLFKPKHRKRLNELLRGLLNETFEWENLLDDPIKMKGFGLKDMAEDTKLCQWPMASILRDLYKAKAGKLHSMPEFDLPVFTKYLQDKSIWYGGYSTEWSDCMKPEAFMQTRLLGIEQHNPQITFPRTAGGADGKNKKIQVSSKDKWIFKKFDIEDELIERYISYKHNEKIISTYLNPDHIKADGRVHTRYENYVRTGRTSSSRPNVQNVPGRDGIRQMYVPAPMHLFASIDYSQLELCSLAQHCYTVYGQSRMRDLINANIDLHCWFGGRTNGLIHSDNDYDGTPESKSKLMPLILDIKENYGKDRKNAKASNFGYPGGMSAETFLRTQRGFGNTDLTIEEAMALRDKWFESFPEMSMHMNPTPDVVTDEDRKRMRNENLRLFKARNILGVVRRKCSYNSACNYPFQSLAAMGAKRAMWAVWRSPYGKYICNFVHDELILELPVETAADDVIAIQKIMVDAMKEVIPDVRIKADGCLMERWDKDAEERFDDFGNLTVWYPEEEAS